MPPRLVPLLFVLLCSTSTFAQLCWKITETGASHSSYLFGTHHLIEPTTIPHLDRVIALCQASERFIGELNEDPNGSSIMRDALSMNGHTLTSLLSPEEYELVGRAFQRTLGMELSLFDEVKPMFTGMFYMMKAHLKALGLKQQPEPVDALLRRSAIEAGCETVGLETLNQQIDILFNSVSLERQAFLLVDAVKETNQTPLNVHKLNDAYLAGDLESLAIMGCDEDWLPEEKHTLLDGRNLNWGKQLPEQLHSHSCFIAVGCLHLVGETGLIHLLREAGFVVEPVHF